jgi:riboflavin transporter FmnP
MRTKATNTRLESRKIARLAKMGVLVATSVVLVAVIHIPFPPLPFLEYDPADIPILLGTCAFGPLAGIVLAVVTAIIQGTTVSAQSGIYGILMHIIATGVLVLVVGLIYKRKKTRGNALVALVAGTLSMAAVMIPANIIITPLFMTVETEAVIGMLPLIIAFNLMKAGINSAVTLLIYKRLSPFLHR